MKHILWCGGSHLANAKSSIIKVFSEYRNEFFVTATPALRQWSIEGGRYSVRGTIVSRNISGCIETIDLNNTSDIVFVGQYLQPKRLFREGELHSRSVIEKCMRSTQFPLYLINNHYNEPLELFPKLVKGNCTLLCDPLPIAGIHPFCIKVFIEEVELFARDHDINFIRQPTHTIDENMQTCAVYKRTDSTTTHFNDSFWRIFIEHAKIFI